MTPSSAEVQAAFQDFVMREDFPCLGARATLAEKSAAVKVLGSKANPRDTSVLARELDLFGKATASEETRFSSLIAVFPGWSVASEVEFDSMLWTLLQQLKDVDSGASPDPTVSDDPEDPHFSFHFMGVAYFVVGLWPSSSRLARRFTWPALVFNPHAVFDRLRREGKYERLKSIIRERDMALQGSLNPNLADFGESSEARQYSGLEHSASWKCPFHKKG